MATLDPRAVRARLTRSGRDARDRLLHSIARLVYRDPVSPPGRLASWLAYAVRMAEPALVERVVRANLEAHGAGALAGAVRAAIDRVPGVRARRLLLTAAWGALRESDADDAAVALGDQLIDIVDHDRIAVTLARLLIERGAITRPLALARRHPARDPDLLRRLEQEGELLAHGYPLPPRAAPAAGGERRVVYYLSQSLPHHSSGYAIRSHWLLRHLVAAGWPMTGVTRFGYPTDRADHAGKPDAPPEAEVDGVRYLFRPDRIGFREPDADYIARAARALTAQARELRPSIIHAASNYQVGLAAIAAARGLGVPSIYEVRGLWHLTKTSKEPGYADTEQYRKAEVLEAQAAGAADHAFVITQAVLDLLAERGVDRGKMSLLPNAVDVDQFTPRPRDEALARELGLAGKVVIGSIGSLKSYEGLDLLLAAAASMRRSLGDRVRVLLVGDGSELAPLAELRGRLGLEEVVVMPGRVPHDEVGRYYSLIDIAAYPRIPALVCHFVSPLKPLEAMAMEKAVVVSDVKAQAEMIEHEVTGLVHAAGDAGALERALTRLVGDPALRARLAARARAWVAAERTWSATAASVAAVYQRLLGG